MIKLKINFLILILVSLSLAACSTDLRQGRPSKSFELIETFSTKEEAKLFFISKRMEYQRLYELNNEPYFGTPDKIECDKNLDIKGKIIESDGNKFFYLKMLANEHEALGDCLTRNNHHYIVYEFHLCSQKVINVRYIFPFDNFHYIPGEICAGYL